MVAGYSPLPLWALAYHFLVVFDVIGLRVLTGLLARCLFDLRVLQDRCAGRSSPVGFPPARSGWT